MVFIMRKQLDVVERPLVCQPIKGIHSGGIILRSGKKGWAVYRDGKVVERYAVMKRKFYHHEMEALIDDLGLEFLGAEKVLFVEEETKPP